MVEHTLHTRYIGHPVKHMNKEVRLNPNNCVAHVALTRKVRTKNILTRKREKSREAHTPGNAQFSQRW